jgi:hypothetical protein
MDCSSPVLVVFFIISMMAMCWACLSLICIFKLYTQRNVPNRTHPRQPQRSFPELAGHSFKSAIVDGDVCYACMEREANTVLLCPNQHGGLCFQCSQKIIEAKVTCPLCRQQVTGLVYMVLAVAEEV